MTEPTTNYTTQPARTQQGYTKTVCQLSMNGYVNCVVSPTLVVCLSVGFVYLFAVSVKSFGRWLCPTCRLQVTFIVDVVQRIFRLISSCNAVLF